LPNLEQEHRKKFAPTFEIFMAQIDENARFSAAS
jgi:hypothetical protein